MKAPKSVSQGEVDLVAFADVFRLYQARTPGGTCARSTVKKWLNRNRLRVFGSNPDKRFWMRSDVVAALNASFPKGPQLLTAEDAFHLVGRSYPSRGKEAACQPR